MNYKDVLIRLASMSLPYVYDDTISFLELDRKLYKIVHELIVAMQGFNSDYETFKAEMTNSFETFKTLITSEFESFTQNVNTQITDFKNSIGEQISTFESEIQASFESFKTQIESEFDNLSGEFTTLKNYVDTYFQNLDLSSEVQKVIQAMYEDGTLANIINEAIFQELNTKIDELTEKVDNLNLVTSIESPLTYQKAGRTSRYYNSAFNNPKDNTLYIATFPNEGNSYTDVEVYYTLWNGSGAGWKITNITSDSDVKGQTVLLQAHVGDSTTFTVVSILPTTEFIKGKIEDLLITPCGNGILQTIGKSYYVYNSTLANPTDNQLYVIAMPDLPNNDYTVNLYDRNQTGGYTGWKITNVSPIDVSEQTILIQAHVSDSTITFTNVGTIPTKKLISSKIGDLLITTCGVGTLQTFGNTYIVYNSNLQDASNNQLFIITMPKLANSSYTTYLYYTSQMGAYSKYAINNALTEDISGQTILIQASVLDSDISFNVIGIIPPAYSFTVQDGEDLTINATNGSVTEKLGKAKIIGNKQALLMGSFLIQNKTGASTITIAPPVIWGSNAFTNGDKLYLQEISLAEANIFMKGITLTYSSSSNAFTGQSSGASGNSAYIIMPQYFNYGAN